MTSLEDLFVDPDGYATLEAHYRRSGDDGGFRTVALSSKRRVLRSSLNADIRRIAPMLARVARRAGWDVLPIRSYAAAIVELTAHLPVYRTYLDANHPDAEADDRSVLCAAFKAVRDAGVGDVAAVDQLERTLLDSWTNAASPVARARLTFVLRWQQITGPAAAKGIEDTALYIHAPLASRNEVGGDPGVPVEGAVERLNTRMLERAERYPRALNATNTHDTKRSADVRARLDALSEHAAEWERTLRRWRRRHLRLRSLVKGRIVPTRTADNFVYQALLGIWPLRPPVGDAWLSALRERLNAYLVKAMREAKISTSWTDPDPEYEAAIAHFLEQLLDAESNAEWMREVDRFVASIAPQAMWNALGRLVVHLAAPGVPDIYRGDELWFSALVDPDNRTPVDWRVRDLTLHDVARRDEHRGCLIAWRDQMDASRLKMLILSRMLAFSRENAFMMSGASFEPLEVRGAYRDSIYAFQRSRAGKTMVVVVPRLTRRLGDQPLGALWEDTHVVLPADSPGEWSSLFQDDHQPATNGTLPVASVFSVLPVAALAADQADRPVRAGPA